jgi:chemotaxis protein MotA
MKAATAIGIVIAVVGILLGATMEGTSVVDFIDIPAFLIVIGGTLGATMASQGMESIRQIPTLYRLVFKFHPPDRAARAKLLVTFAEQARREGLLALDAQLNEVDDEFTRKGLQLIVDGVDPDIVAEVLRSEIDGMTARHRVGIATFEKAGGFAPTMGIIGTVMGLVSVLRNLSQPSTLGPAISSAFIATLLGIGSANVIYLPVANRLRLMSEMELELRYLTLDGILAIQSGDNPRVVAEKLSTYIAPVERDSDEDNVENISPLREEEAA